MQVARLKTPGLHFVGGVDGLALQIAPGGSRSWVLRARMGGKRRDMGLGGFPDVTLAQARDAAREARVKIKQGLDPIDEGHQAKRELVASRAKDVTFKACALQYIAAQEKGWSAKSHKQWLSSLEKHAFPVIGDLIVRHVDQDHVLKVLVPIWHTKTETATRVRGRIERILDWAKVRKLRSGENPAEWKGNLDLQLDPPEKIAEETHFAALPYPELSKFIARLRNRKGQGARCLEFTILTAARSAEARGATWSEIDLQNRVWTIPKERMKGRREHKVPLSSAAMELLRAQPRIEGCDLVFPSAQLGVMSDATMGQILKRMEVDAVPHGFRSTFKDWAIEVAEYPNEMSELALAHTVGSKVEQAYRRGSMFAKRRTQMEEWAAFCEREYVTPHSAEVVDLSPRVKRAR